MSVLSPIPPSPISVVSFVRVLEGAVFAVVIVRPLGSVVVVLLGRPGMIVSLVPTVLPLPNEMFCAASVPVQSIPLTLFGFFEVSNRCASIKTCLGATSNWARSASTPSISFSVAKTTN